MDIRVTRHDGASGFEAVKCIRNGQVFIYDTDWKEVFRADSPVQSAVPTAFRATGAWMPAIFPQTH